eukprot:6234645-Pyramimonas_sp.AAC.1
MQVDQVAQGGARTDAEDDEEGEELQNAGGLGVVSEANRRTLAVKLQGLGVDSHPHDGAVEEVRCREGYGNLDHGARGEERRLRVDKHEHRDGRKAPQGQHDVVDQRLPDLQSDQERGFIDQV